MRTDAFWERYVSFQALWPFTLDVRFAFPFVQTNQMGNGHGGVTLHGSTLERRAGSAVAPVSGECGESTEHCPECVRLSRFLNHDVFARARRGSRSAAAAACTTTSHR